MTTFEHLLPALRNQFPSLSRVDPLSGQPVVYLDGPAGSQVPQSVIDAVGDYYLHHNANTGGTFATSGETMELMKAAHQAAADWFGTPDSSECIFGANMTTMTLAFARALSQTWAAGEQIVVTELDHDGNVTPWTLAARDRGVNVATVRANPADATLDEEDFDRKVVPGTRLVAFTAASNSVGSTTRIRDLAAKAHAVGAEVYVDAVHWAPHRLIDVVDWDVDYCVCSAYKFFGPHVGLLWGRKSRLEQLTPYKLRPAPTVTPGKWMTGTQNFAAIAGVRAAIDYVASIGKQLALNSTSPNTRRQQLQAAFTAIQAYETSLAIELLHGLSEIPAVSIWGITAAERLDERVPTIAITVAGQTSLAIAEQLATRGIYCWHGNYYAVDICRVLGHEQNGMVRIGILHTTTREEIVRLLDALRKIARKS